MPDTALLLSAVLLGLSGAGHCLGMCGGLTAALQLGGNNGQRSAIVFHSARIASYALLGALAGLVSSISESATAATFFRYLASGLLIAMGLYIGEWWQGLATLEKTGAKLFRPLQNSLSRLRLNSPLLASLVLGLCWATMPCGLIYSALAWSATTQNALSAAVLMLTFGIGTLPAMFAVSLGANRLQAFLRNRNLKRVIAVFLITAGLWSGYITSLHSNHSMQPHTGEHSQEAHSGHGDR